MATDNLASPFDGIDAPTVRPRPPLLLLADPEEDRRVSHADLLRHAGYEVVAVAEVAEALSHAARALPSLIAGKMSGVHPVAHDHRVAAPLAPLAHLHCVR